MFYVLKKQRKGKKKNETAVEWHSTDCDNFRKLFLTIIDEFL